MILAAHQPAYLPWLGYLDRIARSDAFVFLDTVQFEKNSFTNRNRVKTPQGPAWLTIPVKVKGHTHSTMQELQIDNAQNWKIKHLKTLKMNYSKAPMFAERWPKLEELYARPFDLLSDLCFEHLAFWLAELGVSRRVVRARDLKARSLKSELILDLCSELGANEYLSGPFGKDYLDEKAFQAAGVAVSYHEFKSPEYPQLYGPFVPNLGVVDLWMNAADPSSILARKVS